MTSGGLLRTTVIGCAIAAVAAVVAGCATGRASAGIGVGAGLLLGSINGYLVQGLLSRGAPMVGGSMLRIVLFSSLVLVAALVLRGEAWSVPLGIGLAQLVMVGAGLRQGLRRA